MTEEPRTTCALETEAPQEDWDWTPEEPEGEPGVFQAAVLLESPAWDAGAFQERLAAEWGAQPTVETGTDGMQTVLMEDVPLTVRLVTEPLDQPVWEEAARLNYLEADMGQTVGAHAARLEVRTGEQAAEDGSVDFLGRAAAFVKVVSTLAGAPGALAVLANGTAVTPRFYRSFAEGLAQDEFPLFNVVWFGLYEGEEGVGAFTRGLRAFASPEIEVPEAEAEPESIRDFLADVAAYVILEGQPLQGGETVGFSDNDRHAIAYGPGDALPGYTLKVDYWPARPDNSAKKGKGRAQDNSRKGGAPDKGRKGAGQDKGRKGRKHG